MPKFVFRLEAQDGSGHFRQGAIEAESKEDARATLERREQRNSDYRLTTDRIAELAEIALPGAADKDRKALADSLVSKGTGVDGFRSLPGLVRGAVALHHQEKPYKLVSLTKAKG